MQLAWAQFPRYSQRNSTLPHVNSSTVLMSAAEKEVYAKQVAMNQAYLDYQQLWGDLMSLLRDLRTRPKGSHAERYLYAIPDADELLIKKDATTGDLTYTINAKSVDKELLDKQADAAATALEKVPYGTRAHEQAETALYLARMRAALCDDRKRQLQLWIEFRLTIAALARNAYVVAKRTAEKLSESAYCEALMSMVN